MRNFPLQPLKNNKYRIFKSRYDSIDSYLSSCGEKYNDIDLTIDEEINKQLLDAGIRLENGENNISEMQVYKKFEQQMTNVHSHSQSSLTDACAVKNNQLSVCRN